MVKLILWLGAIIWWAVYTFSGVMGEPSDTYLLLAQFWLLSALTYKE
jgi:hypothetical protein